MRLVEKFHAWFLLRSLGKSKRRLHWLAQDLYSLRGAWPNAEERINAFLDEDIYPIIRRLDELHDGIQDDIEEATRKWLDTGRLPEKKDE